MTIYLPMKKTTAGHINGILVALRLLLFGKHNWRGSIICGNDV